MKNQLYFSTILILYDNLENGGITVLLYVFYSLRIPLILLYTIYNTRIFDEVLF